VTGTWFMDTPAPGALGLTVCGMDLGIRGCDNGADRADREHKQRGQGLPMRSAGGRSYEPIGRGSTEDYQRAEKGQGADCAMSGGRLESCFPERANHAWSPGQHASPVVCKYNPQEIKIHTINASCRCP
jgi:hypothetical protein